MKKKPRQQGVPRAGQGRGRGRGRGAGKGAGGEGAGNLEAEGSNSGPGGVIREELDCETPEPTSLGPEMSGRGREVQNLRRQRPRGRGADVAAGTPRAGTSRAAPISAQGCPEKRARPSEGVGIGGGEPETILINKEEEEQRARTGGEGTDAETRVLAREVPWAPEVCHYAGHMIHHADCTATNIGTAFGLLQSTILPRDAKTVGGCTKDLTGEIAQALLAAQEAEIEELKQALAQKEDDLRVARETCDLYLTDFQKCDGKRVLVEARAAKAEEDAKTLRTTRAREVEGALKAGYDDGWDAAAVEYTKQVREIENELFRDRFLDRLRFGHEGLLKKLDLLEDLELRALPEATPKGLVMPEEGEQIPDP
ncbi:hypothetical protein RHMOL_Rhmol10G0165500 [Rhododendron molle]|uniref:Uncharacterized protein n=1 Tax=Rhododendron molle TaxID=49168 RepID=A0ACC0M389_RHOML|nr:hypothetical protein RHMOL_Rhmol10G0165500 [Rhododendron molle]